MPALVSARPASVSACRHPGAARPGLQLRVHTGRDLADRIDGQRTARQQLAVDGRIARRADGQRLQRRHRAGGGEVALRAQANGAAGLGRGVLADGQVAHRGQIQRACRCAGVAQQRQLAARVRRQVAVAAQAALEGGIAAGLQLQLAGAGQLAVAARRAAGLQLEVAIGGKRAGQGRIAASLQLRRAGRDRGSARAQVARGGDVDAASCVLLVAPSSTSLPANRSVPP